MIDQESPVAVRARKAVHAICPSCLVISFLLFAASLPQVGYFVDGPRDTIGGRGGSLLATGWIGILQGVYAWLANPFLLFAWIAIAFRPRIYSFLLAAVSLAFALSFLSVTVVRIDEVRPSLVTGYGTGYWFWIASIATTLIGMGIAYWCELIAAQDEHREREAEYHRISFGEQPIDDRVTEGPPPINDSAPHPPSSETYRAE